MTVFVSLRGCHNIEHSDAQQNDTQHNSAQYWYAECHYTECQLCQVSFMLRVPMLGVIILNVIMLNVMPPFVYGSHWNLIFLCDLNFPVRLIQSIQKCCMLV
jgi:hypothetical protein